MFSKCRKALAIAKAWHVEKKEKDWWQCLHFLMPASRRCCKF